MKALADLKHGECKYALTTSEKSDKSWAHARLGDTKGVVMADGEIVGGGNYPHRFCGKTVQHGSVYCPEHHALCYRGHGKDARSLEEMIYATDKSQYRGRSNYAEHTDPVDKEVADKDVPRLPGGHGPRSLQRSRAAAATAP